MGLKEDLAANTGKGGTQAQTFERAKTYVFYAKAATGLTGDGTEFVLCAPDLDSLERVWNKLSMPELNAKQVQEVVILSRPVLEPMP